MALIENVDYEAIPAKAKEMREHGKELNGEMTKAYATIAEMHAAWYGDRYNELVKVFNRMIPSLNEMLTLVVTDFPFALETIANNYSQVDRGQNVTVASNEGPNKLNEIVVTEDVGMKFLTADVQNAQERVSTNFINSRDLMDKIETVYSTIDWKSEASDAFKSKFTKLKNNIVASFEETNSQFKKLMEQTQQDVQNAENANTVN